MDSRVVHVERMDDDGGEWDSFVNVAGEGSIFHTTAWRDAVAESFGHQPFYLAARRSGRVAAVLPLFLVKSLLGGRLLVSVPYGVYGGVLGADSKSIIALLRDTDRLGRDLGARCVELRSRRAVWRDAPVVDRYVTFRKALPPRPQDCLALLPRKARAAARAGWEKHALTVSHGDGHLPRVWELYADTMRRLGSINYPYRFFESLARHTPGRHFVTLLSHREKPVAGLFTLVYRGEAMPYFAGFDARRRHLNLSNVLYLSAMEHAVECGCTLFDFGRSRRDNSGACAFKSHQGFEAEPLEYQVRAFPGCSAPNLSPSHRRFTVARRCWPLLPRWVTRPLGGWLSKHLPG